MIAGFPFVSDSYRANYVGMLITPLAVFITVGSIVNGRIVTRIPNPNVMLLVGFAMIAVISLAQCWDLFTGRALPGDEGAGEGAR